MPEQTFSKLLPKLPNLPKLFCDSQQSIHMFFSDVFFLERTMALCH